MNYGFKAPPRSERLFDLCKFDFEKARVGFFFALNNSLVCDRLETAKSINQNSQQKFRILTLDGYNLYPNGSMQGGGTAKTGMVNTGAQINYNTAQIQEDYKKEQRKIAQITDAIRLADQDFERLKSNEIDIGS